MGKAQNHGSSNCFQKNNAYNCLTAIDLGNNLFAGWGSVSAQANCRDGFNQPVGSASFKASTE